MMCGGDSARYVIHLSQLALYFEDLELEVSNLIAQHSCLKICGRKTSVVCHISELALYVDDLVL